MKLTQIIVIALVIVFFSNSTLAQGVPTVLAVKSALEGAIAEFRKGLAEATSDV
jgi:hypothetical protein